MYVTIDSSLSCGIVQVGGLECRHLSAKTNHLDLLKNAVESYSDSDSWDLSDGDVSTFPSRPFFVWSDKKQTDKVGGYALVKAIRKKRNFGEVTVSKWLVNQNTGNKIRLYTWTPSKEAHKFLGWRNRKATALERERER